MRYYNIIPLLMTLIYGCDGVPELMIPKEGHCYRILYSDMDYLKVVKLGVYGAKAVTEKDDYYYIPSMYYERLREIDCFAIDGVASQYPGKSIY